jgi:hypothetical protein
LEARARSAEDELFIPKDWLLLMPSCRLRAAAFERHLGQYHLELVLGQGARSMS